jgi:hypothetical protein
MYHRDEDEHDINPARKENRFKISPYAFLIGLSGGGMMSTMSKTKYLACNESFLFGAGGWFIEWL